MDYRGSRQILAHLIRWPTAPTLFACLLVAVLTVLGSMRHGAAEGQSHLAGHRVLIGDAADAVGSKQATLRRHFSSAAAGFAAG